MKAKKIITIVVTALAALITILSGIMKLTMAEEIVTGMTKVGVGDFIIMLGLMEITFALLFIYPKTMKVGFLLLICYFAGALATELSYHLPFNALMPMILIWVAAFLRDRSIFISKTVVTT